MRKDLQIKLKKVSKATLELCSLQINYLNLITLTLDWQSLLWNMQNLKRKKTKAHNSKMNFKTSNKMNTTKTNKSST